MMLLKNYSAITLCWILPLRIMLEYLTLAASVIMGQPHRSIAVLMGLNQIIRYLPAIIRRRKIIQGLRTVPDHILMRRMYRGSTALAYFIRGMRTAAELSGKYEWK